MHVSAAVAGQRRMLRTLLTQGRSLDNQNPRRAALGSDFGRLGFSFVDELKAAQATAAGDLDDLEVLIDYRNAIGHGNEAAVATIEAAGVVKATKAAYTARRGSLDRLAGIMDDVVADKLAALLGIPKPW